MNKIFKTNTDLEKPQLMLSIGGDGTLLEAATFIGTLQAGYTDFLWLAQTIDFVIMLLKDPAVHKVFNTTSCTHPN